MGRTVVALIIGFLCGVGWLHLMYKAQEKEFKAKDLLQSYEKGFKDALDADRPSERLEYICAALWLKGNEK